MIRIHLPEAEKFALILNLNRVIPKVCLLTGEHCLQTVKSIWMLDQMLLTKSDLSRIKK